MEILKTGIIGEDFAVSNGNRRVDRSIAEGVAPDWRREAMAAAMRCQSEDGSPWACLIGAFQERSPERAVCFFVESRKVTLEIFAELLDDFTAYLEPTFKTRRDGDLKMLTGWWRGVGKEDGAEYELALGPNPYGDREWVFCGPNEASLQTLITKLREAAVRRMNRCRRYAQGKWREDAAIEEECQRASWEDIVLPAALTTEIRAAVETFFAQKETFHRLGFAWRRGLLLVGPPGTGKTMICKAVARSFPELPFLYVQNFARGDLDNDEDSIATMFSYARKAAPCILAFEDIDGLLEGQNRAQFLNEMDGFQNNDGLLIIASSNHPEKIDEALLKRPSRFDRVYHIGLPEAAERAEYCRRLLAKSPLPLEGVDVEELSAKIAAASSGFTPAFLKEALLSATLAAAQDNQAVLGSDFAFRVLEQVDALKKYLKKARDPHALAEMTAASAPEIGFRSR